MLIGEPLKRRHAVLLFSAQPTKGTPVVPATTVGIVEGSATMSAGLVDIYGLGSPSALFFEAGEAISRLSLRVTALQSAAFLIRGERAAGTVPWNTIGIGVVDDAGVGYAWQLPDTKIGSMEVSCEAGGFLQASFDLTSIGLLSEPTGLVMTQLTPAPLKWFEGVVLKGGAAWESRSIRLSVNHNLDPKHVLYGVAPTTNKRAPKYLPEGSEVVTFETQRYARTAINLQADCPTDFAVQATFTAVCTPANTVTLDLTGAKYGEEEFTIGDDVLFRASGMAKTFNWTQTP